MKVARTKEIYNQISAATECCVLGKSYAYVQVFYGVVQHKAKLLREDGFFSRRPTLTLSFYQRISEGIHAT